MMLQAQSWHQEEKPNHESTKTGKHEKGHVFLNTPSSFVLSSVRVFVMGVFFLGDFAEGHSV
jgi:hypothetical protein